MGCCSSKSSNSGPPDPPTTIPPPISTSSSSLAPSPEHRLNTTDLVFLVIGPAGSGAVSFAETAVGRAGASRRSSLLTVPDHFQKSDIHVRRTTISQKQVVFIVPQEFDGDNVQETHVIMGVKEWLDNNRRGYSYVDYILFLSEQTSPLQIKLKSQLHYLDHLCRICNLEDSNALYSKNKVSFITRTGPDENSHVGVPDEWEAFVQKGCPVYNFTGTLESAQSTVSNIMS